MWHELEQVFCSTHVCCGFPDIAAAQRGIDFKLGACCLVQCLMFSVCVLSGRYDHSIPGRFAVR